MMFETGSIVRAREREWVVQAGSTEELLLLSPLGGATGEQTGIYTPLEKVESACFPLPDPSLPGDWESCRMLQDALQLGFRSTAGPFRSFGHIQVDPRPYQFVPLILAMRMDPVRMLLADDVGIGKTVEALLIARELMDRGEADGITVICPPHLAEQWQQEMKDKFHIDAELVLGSTAKKLERDLGYNHSLFDVYRNTVVSLDYIKDPRRRDEFKRSCSNLVLVDEAHTCTEDFTARVTLKQQRYQLLKELANNPARHMLLLTATPHSGKASNFTSLLMLLDPSFASLPDNLQGEQNRKHREHLARHLVQRRRADIREYLANMGGEAAKSPFPDRLTQEATYSMNPEYRALIEDALDWARKTASAYMAEERTFRSRVRWWSALALLRSISSSPAAAAATLEKRSREDSREDIELIDELGKAQVLDGDAEHTAALVDFTPAAAAEDAFTSSENQRLRQMAEKAQSLKGDKDPKMLQVLGHVEGLLRDAYRPIIFCRFIDTAEYLAEELRKRLPSGLKAEVAAVTGRLAPEERKQRIGELSRKDRYVLVATDCLSEGINLQDLFTGVLHYDLPWNPNRLEQREGRVDRFGQKAAEVKACLVYGADNPIDGIVLDVLLRKVREIKRATGINVPFPEDSQSIIDTITQALLLNPDRRIARRRGADQQMLFDFTDFGEAAAAKANITRKIDEAAARETASRSIFAQNAIKAQDIAEDLRAVDEAIGNVQAVESFVTSALADLFGVQVTRDRSGYGIVTGNLPPQLADLLAGGQVSRQSRHLVKVSFESPTPEGYLYLGRNNRFVEQLCQLVMANTLARQDKRAARAAVIRTRQVTLKTTLMLFRCRNVIEQGRGGHQIVAEEMLLWGWRGTPDQKSFLSHAEARDLLAAARATSDLSPQARAAFLENELSLLDRLDTEFTALAEAQSKRLVAAHERFSALMDKQRFQVVYPVLPMDLLGLYILLPE